MAIVATELKFFQPTTRADGPANGGRMTSTQIITGTKNNIFPDVDQAGRTAGLTRYRKVFFKVENDADETLFNAKMFLTRNTPGDDAVYMFAATQTDTESDITGAEQLYLCAPLAVAASSGASSIQVTLEDATVQPILTGQTIRISNKPTIDSGTGVDEYHVVLSTSLSGSVLTINLDGTTLANAFGTATTYISNVLDYGDIEALISGTGVTSSAGTYDFANLLPDAIGSVDDTWTLTFTSATDFDVVGSDTGSVGSGSIAADFEPINADAGQFYFSLGSAGFGGTYVSGDVINFTTTPASAGLWLKQVVPAGANSLSGNYFRIGVDGESA